MYENLIDSAKSVSSKAIKITKDSSVQIVEKSKEEYGKVRDGIKDAALDASDKTISLLNRTKDTSLTYGKDTISKASKSLDEAVQKVKETPQQVVRSIVATKDELAMRSMARAKKTRNFLVVVFLGGCTAFGLGIGLGMGGFRRHLE